MLKKLFYASASILMLALAYHLGATTATAQAPGNAIECALAGEAGDYAIAVMGRYIYKSQYPQPVSLAASLPIPGTSPVIACSAAMVVLENGEVWHWYTSSGGEWALVGNFGGTTPAQQRTWGQLKAQYRK